MYKLQKHRAEENSPFSDDKGEKPCQFAKPEKPPCLPSLETDATRVRAADLASDVVVPHEGGSRLDSPSAVQTGGAPEAASIEPLVSGVVPRVSSKLEIDGLPIKTDATAADASVHTADPAPDVVVPHEGGCGLGSPSAIDTGGAPRAASVEPAGNGVVARESSEVELSSLPSVETDVAPGASSAEPLANGVMSRESSEVELGGLPIVETNATCSDAGACAADPAPEVVVPHA